ncbi:MAG: LOG family protein [Pyrinomonadaceae bacterium]|nr:LOG family protein [Pyrinomonadaceae bacterium]
MSRFVVGVIGAGRASERDEKNARELGELIAREGWVVLSGGRRAGVMKAVNEGAKRVAGSLTIGILPTATRDEGSLSEHVDVAIYTGMGNARNNINVLSSHVVVACGATGPGTVSEIALALKAPVPRRVILLTDDEAAITFFRKLGGEMVTVASTPFEVVEQIKKVFGK